MGYIIDGEYLQKTWAPRGAETAQYLYNISEGWVTHNEVRMPSTPLQQQFSNTRVTFV